MSKSRQQEQQSRERLSDRLLCETYNYRLSCVLYASVSFITFSYGILIVLSKLVDKCMATALNGVFGSHGACLDNMLLGVFKSPLGWDFFCVQLI